MGATTAAAVRDRPRRWLDAVGLLRMEALLLGVLPAGLVFGPLGGVGSPARVLGLGLFLLWACSAFTPGLGVRACVPVRIVLALTWVSTLVSYVLLHFDAVNGVEVTSADTYLIQLLAFSGVALTAAECLRSKDEVLVVVRTAVFAAGFSAFVAILQFRPGIDISSWFAKIPFLSANGTFGDIQARGGFNRPPGTAVHPIEFSVITATALAFAIHLFLYDGARPYWRRALTFGVIAVAVPISISRSALVAAAVVVVYFIVGAPPALRTRAFAFLGGFSVVIFVLIPGMIGTLKGLVTAGASDSSIATRTSDYAAVARYIRPHPWFGRGGGTFLPSYRILDNQYLLTLIELGLVGLVCLIVLYFSISCLGRAARRHARSEPDRSFSQMCAAAGMACLVALFTFDALSFPTFTAFSALWLGIAGAWWACLRRERADEAAAIPAPAQHHQQGSRPRAAAGQRHHRGAGPSRGEPR
jgi:polysaccharide biosynthesis protein PslJ